MLNEFVMKYDKTVYNRRYAEEDEDFKTMNSKGVLSSDHPIEQKVGDCYTRRTSPERSLDYTMSRHYGRADIC
ncbi:hypothetical protein RJ640_007278 [Escallonia rubra]|uniref:Uncharacterized protein n=1 Tax=Escallonia rubra TaxID=112253 RepID=A0AA88UEV0_9ASTE|nr:hypothetical protein RJ640_007278 [Escallonia rubra]